MKGYTLSSSEIICHNQTTCLNVKLDGLLLASVFNGTHKCPYCNQLYYLGHRKILQNIND